MTVPQDPYADELLAEELEAYQQSLERGDASSSTSHVEQVAAEPLRMRISRAKRCLDLLWAATQETEASGSSAMPGGYALPGSVGRFEVQAELGSGGFGIVYLALDPVTQRQVALKVPRIQAFASAELLQRFQHESTAAAKLDHPSLVPVFEAGLAGSIPYIASMYYDGPTLAQWLSRRTEPVSGREAAELVRQLALGVQHAHARGVLHRDIKPSNVLLAPCEGKLANSQSLADFVPKLMDFGLAKLTESTADFTKAGVILGTARYMAPEQARGDLQAMTTATDVYSLGVCLYELLTDGPLFNSANDVELLMMIAAEEPRRPRRVRGDVPSDLETICLKCVAKDPKQRYRSAGELADELGRYLDGEPILSRPAGGFERLAKWTRRRPWIAALIGVIAASLLTLGGTVAIYTVQLREALATSEQRRAEAEDSRQIVRRQLYASDVRSASDAWKAYRAGECVDILLRQTPVGGDADLREFCWGHLWQQSHQAIQELSGHRGWVHAVEYSSDGRFLVSAGEDGVVRAWDATTGRLVQELDGHDSEINALAFAPDGRQLAAVSDQGSLLLWSLGDEFRFRLRAAVSQSELYALCYSPDGTQIALGGDDAQVRVVSASNGVLKRELSQHTGPVVAVCFWSGGRRLISGGKDGQLLSWDLSGDSPEKPEIWLADDGPAIRDFDLSTDEKHIAVARGYVDVLRLSDQEREAKLPKESEDFSSVRFASDGNRILCANHDSTWRSWEWKSAGDAVRVIAGHTGRVFSAVFSPDGKQVATAGADGLVRRWDADLTGAPYQVTLECPQRCAAEFSANGDWLLLKESGNGESLRLVLYAWRQGSWQVAASWEFSDQTEAVECAVSSDGSRVVRTDREHNLLAWQQGGSDAWMPIGERGARIDRLAIAPSGQTVLSASKGKLRAWGMTPVRLLWEAEIPQQDFGTRLYATTEAVACSAGYGVVVLDLKTGNQLYARERIGMEIRALAITVDGHELQAAGSDRSIYRWALPGGGPLVPWIGHQSGIERLAIHPENRTILTCDQESRLKLWHRATGQVLLSWQPGPANAVSFSADGRYLHVVRHSPGKRTQVVSYLSQTPAQR